MDASHRLVSFSRLFAFFCTAVVIIIIDFLISQSPIRRGGAPKVLKNQFHRSPIEGSFKQDKCFLYDKPPRTGSSTVSNALRKCWMSHKFLFPPSQQQLQYNSTISTMLNTSAKNVAITGVHFSMPAKEIEKLFRDCRNMFYVTSTRSMRERIASKAKYEVSNGRVYMNTTLTTEQMKTAFEKARADNTSEERLEAYPFPEKKRLNPDYIIRSEMFSDDLQSLLRAFNCNESFFSKNLHKAETETNQSSNLSHVSEASFADNVDYSAISLQLGDARHIRLSRMAKLNNMNGLQKASRLIQ